MPLTQDAHAQGEAILAATVELARDTWRERLVAAYALGSLAHGGFSAVSDVDVGLLLADPLVDSDADQMTSLTDSIKRSERRFADRLSVFWGSLASLSGAASGGRFPPLDRLDLKKYGRLMAGQDVRAELPLPSQRELVVAGAELALRRLATDAAIDTLTNPEALARSDQKTLTRMILWPVRFLFTARTGDVGRNDAAVEHFAAHGRGPSVDLARLALRWRDVRPAPSEAISAIKLGLVPLYLELLMDHEPRLREYARPDLADAFRVWRQRLLG